MKRSILMGVLAILALVLVLTVPSSFAQSGEATVTADTLNVRAIPGLNAQVVGEVTNGTTVTMTGREDELGNGGVWVRITAGSVQGWVLSDYLAFGININSLPVVSATAPVAGGGGAPAADANAAAASVPAGSGFGAEVTTDSNLRGGPGTNFPRVGGVVAGAQATLIGRNDDGSWVRGNFGGTDAWIAVGLVRPGGNVTTLPVVGTGPLNTAGQPAPAAADAPAAAPAAGNVPPPVAGGGGIGGFSYGAHVNGFGGTEVMSSIGMTWMKKQVRYNRGDGPGGAIGLANEARGRGFRILLGVVGNPAQIAADPNGYFQDYANFVGGLAAGGADAIEIWNEPNLDREWPAGMVDPAMYTQLLALSYNAIKSNNPNTIVISGAPAPTGFFGGCTPNGCDDGVYISGMAAAGAASYMDCVGVHYNEGVVSPTQSAGDPRSDFYTRFYPTMVNVYYNAFRKPLCFTELGYVTGEGYGGMPPGFEWGGNNTVAEQAQWLADAIALAAQDSRVRLLIVWNFNFNTAPGTPDPAGAYAMVRPDGTCPACDAIARRR